MEFLRRITQRLLIPFKLIPKDGITSETLVFSITIGVVAGIFPVIGTTTILSILLTILFRQNVLIVQAIQWSMAIFQIALIVPFMLIGNNLLQRQPLHINIRTIEKAFNLGFLNGIETIGVLHLYAIFAWILLVVPIGLLVFGLIKFQKKGNKSE